MLSFPHKICTLVNKRREGSLVLMGLLRLIKGEKGRHVSFAENMSCAFL